MFQDHGTPGGGPLHYLGGAPVQLLRPHSHYDNFFSIFLASLLLLLHRGGSTAAAAAATVATVVVVATTVTIIFLHQLKLPNGILLNLIFLRKIVVVIIFVRTTSKLQFVLVMTGL